MITISRSTIYKRCSLCFTKDGLDGDNLINLDGLQLCQKCYDKFRASGYNQRCMLLNSLNCYRRLISKYEDNGNIILDTNFKGIADNLKDYNIFEENEKN